LDCTMRRDALQSVGNITALRKCSRVVSRPLDSD
jgi:hypothetical protein